MVERSDQSRVSATFFCAQEFDARQSVSLADDAAQHARVLRIGPGAIVELRNGRGGAASGTLMRMTKSSLSIQVDKTWEIPALPEVHMIVPVGDRDRMLMLAEKTTELGATSWRPVLWRRSKSVTARGEGPMFVGRTRGRMIAALTQSGGGWLPEIHPSASVSRAIAAAPDGTRILLDANGDDSISSLVSNFPIVIAVGPEGGLADDERTEMIEGGFKPARIATTTLRFETAAIAALAIARVPN